MISEKTNLPVGVFQKKGRDTFYSMVQRSCKKPIYLGSFDTPELAKEKYDHVNSLIKCGQYTFNEALKEFSTNKRMSRKELLSYYKNINSDNWATHQKEMYDYITSNEGKHLDRLINKYYSEIYSTACGKFRCKNLAYDMAQESILGFMRRLDNGLNRIDLFKNEKQFMWSVNAGLWYCYLTYRRENGISNESDKEYDFEREGFMMSD